MKRYAWNEEKNVQLLARRGVSFEQAVFHIENGDVLEVFDNPNQARYPGQGVFVVSMANYAYLVPYVESDEEFFLKTIFPSRKAARKHGVQTQ